MSSAVNKSQKRFIPKLASLGPAVRGGHGRRLSTLRTTFSVPNMPADSITRQQLFADGSGNKQGPQEQQLASTDDLRPVARAQMFGLSPADVSKASDQAIDEDSELVGIVPRLTEVEVTDSASSSTTDINVERLPASKRRRRSSVVPHKRLNRPASIPSPTPSSGDNLPAPYLAIVPPSADVSSMGFSITSSMGEAIMKEADDHEGEDAPHGCEFVDLDSIPQLKMNERKRKIAFEREFVAIMRDLYTAKEKEKLLVDAHDLPEEYFESQARQAALRATYCQLKQAVGTEARALRDSRHGGQSQEQQLKPVINEKKTTMATLCKDLPFGDQNNNFDDYELARVNRRRATMRVFRAKMWSRGLYQPREEERTSLQEAYKKYLDERRDRTGKIKTEQQQKFTEIDDATADGSHPQATIEIQANGDISLVGTQYDRHRNNRVREQSGGLKTEVDPTEQVINSFSYSTKERPDRWTKEETEKFYEAVSALGTDFSLISHLFPMRSRNQIKTKFKYEEKRNPAKLQIYMVSRRKFNIDSYSKVSNVAIQDVESIEFELEKVRMEHEAQMKLEEASRLEAKVEDQKSSVPGKRINERHHSARAVLKREH